MPGTRFRSHRWAWYFPFRADGCSWAISEEKWSLDGWDNTNDAKHTVLPRFSGEFDALLIVDRRVLCHGNDIANPSREDVSTNYILNGIIMSGD